MRSPEPKPHRRRVLTPRRLLAACAVAGTCVAGTASAALANPATAHPAAPPAPAASNPAYPIALPPGEITAPAPAQPARQQNRRYSPAAPALRCSRTPSRRPGAGRR